jgi:hypothetical protein
MATTPAPIDRPTWLDDQTLEAVRPQVRKILETSPGFARLSDSERRALAANMVTIASYLSNPEGLGAQSVPSVTPPPLARTQADAVEATKSRLSQAPGFTGKDFKAEAVKEGVEQFGQLVKKVDFPKFVSGLIKGVFQAIVESSIEQMRAYGELLANVAKTVGELAQDNITQNNARDWLAQKYPDKLAIETPSLSGELAEGETPSPQPKLVAKGDDPQASAKAISADLNMEKPVTDLSNEEDEVRLVDAARLQMARGRQQLLASMVMLGINRIVVTDGLIHAKVVFDMRASDVAKRQARASMYDSAEEKSATHAETGFGGWMNPVSASLSTDSSSDHITTVESSVDETSESKAEVKANLTGEVRVNFKSDYFPMEKMASPQMIAAIQGNATPPAKPVSGA